MFTSCRRPYQIPLFSFAQRVLIRQKVVPFDGELFYLVLFFKPITRLIIGRLRLMLLLQKSFRIGSSNIEFRDDYFLRLQELRILDMVILNLRVLYETWLDFQRLTGLSMNFLGCRVQHLVLLHAFSFLK